ncbi:vacuolar protein sorting-associated protein 32 homolog 2-like isoform X2 [Magnolia sinica]|uniref:vacuolar protein sorting-associated protein 32 homolog 2-like isoform X2 n=1 Tax=Magnolia sinica TaxID=86752 RepID=UPI0026597652|nr:vacuolar protein sorting-associated protein 32 homolog 2-like isoform X2 [Magnolia sinica]
MFSRLFRKCTEETHHLSSSHTLQQTLEVLEEKENVLQKKISIEVERAKEFTRAKNKQAALQCLKRKKFYEGQMEHLGNFQLRIHDQLPQKLPTHCGQVQRVKDSVKKTYTKSSFSSQQLELEPSGNYSGALVPYK